MVIGLIIVFSQIPSGVSRHVYEGGCETHNCGDPDVMGVGWSLIGMGLVNEAINLLENEAESTIDEWDITLEEFDEGRANYEAEVSGIKDQAQNMLEDGYSDDDVAEWAVNERREIGVRYKNLTPPGMREEIYARNVELYGDPLGPNIDFYREQGYTNNEIIDSASRPGGKDIVPILRERLLERIQ